MNWNDVWKIVLSSLAAAGGIGGVTLAIIKFSSNIIAERLSKKYDLKLQKSLEQYKTKLDEGIHISKEVFDKEFEVYQSLLRIIADIETKIASINGFNKSDVNIISEEDINDENVGVYLKKYQNGEAISKEQLCLLVDSASELGLQFRTMLSYSGAFIPHQNLELFITMYNTFYLFIHNQSEENFQSTITEKGKLQTELRKYLEKLKVVE